jgi:Glycosyl hydrolases family 16
MGEVLLAEGTPRDAEACHRKALDIARPFREVIMFIRTSTHSGARQHVRWRLAAVSAVAATGVTALTGTGPALANNTLSPRPAAVRDVAVIQAAAGKINWGKPVAAENFNGTKLNLKRWYYYHHTTPPRRSPTAVHVRNGQLVLAGHIDKRLGDISGGVGDRFSQTYGRWVIRFRASRGAGYAPTVLLWPRDNKRPAEGEMDLAEILDPARQTAQEVMHIGNRQRGPENLHADFTKWHTIAIDWLPSHITTWLDGHKKWTVWRNSDPSKNVVPSTPFRLALQNDQGCDGNCHRTASTPKYVTMYVDWVRIYSRPAGVH